MHTWPGRFVDAASFVMEIEDVFDARMACEGTTRSRLVSSSRFNDEFSLIALMWS